MKKIDNHQQTEWQQHVAAYRNGKLSRAAYCKIHNIGYHQFGYWIKKFKAQTNLIPIRIKQQPSEELSETASTVLCTLQLKQKVILKIHDLKALTVVLGLYSNAV